MAQELLSNKLLENDVITNEPKLVTSVKAQEKWGTVVESIIDNLKNRGDKEPAAALLNKEDTKNNGKTNIYKRTFYESIYLGDQKPIFHSETAKVFQTNDWQDIKINGNKIFESMNAENIGDLEDMIKKYHICMYVIKLTLTLAESEKCSDHCEFMRMLEFVAKYIEQVKKDEEIGHTHVSAKHHVSFNNSANIIIPSSTRTSFSFPTMTKSNEEQEEEEEVKQISFLCFSCKLDIFNCCKSSSSSGPSQKVIAQNLMDSGLYLRNIENASEEEDDDESNNKKEIETTTNNDNSQSDQLKSIPNNSVEPFKTEVQLLNIEMRPQAMYKVKIPRNLSAISKKNRVR
uniref:CSON000805 protein n=1 Tax=Culicoides sonorensis TaxID=179676 RepID=A0A336K8Z0_CULSO